MAKKLTKAQQSLLDTIKAGGETGVAVEQNDNNVQALVTADMIETAIVEGQLKARAKSEPKPNGAAAVETTVSTSAFEVENDFPLAAAQRGGRKEEQYPFSKLEVGQSFVVPATEEYPKPWETFASTVSSATRRHAIKSDKTRVNRAGATVPVLVPTKKFTLRKVTAGDTYPNGKTEKVTGARVFRIQ